MGSASVLILGLLVVDYAPLSRRLESSVLTPPMLFTAAGLLLGPSLLDVLDRNADEHDLEVLAEAALAVLLFTEAATLDLGKVVREGGFAAPPPRRGAAADDGARHAGGRDRVPVAGAVGGGGASIVLSRPTRRSARRSSPIRGSPG